MAPAGGPTCPHCGSTDTTFRPKAREWDCQNCERRFVEAAGACAVLADSPDWVDEVINGWPGPIAHEYHRLRKLLTENQLVASVWQLKDVAEVLIRFPACVMARDVLEHGSDAAFRREVRRTLLGPPMSMGGWQQLAETLGRHIVTHADDLVAREVATLFWTPADRGHGQATDSNQLLKNMTAWRNRSFGHGAFRADQTEFLADLTDQLPPLHRELAAHKDVWRGLILQRADGTPLTGAASITPHPASAELTHAMTPEELELTREDRRELLLAPYVQLRTCTVCTSRDVFVFDWRRLGKSEGRDHYGFLDYRAGHGSTSRWFQEPELERETKELGSTPEVGAVAEGTVDEDYLPLGVSEMLAERATSERYRKPGHLRDRLKAFLRAQESGVFWLRAPGHTGKSTFVSGLDPRYQADLKEAPLTGDLADIAVLAFYIRREYQTWPTQLREQLADQLRQALDLVSGAKGLPQLDLDVADPERAMVDWLQEWRSADGGRHRLLVCLDGLDELAPSDERSILDFIPEPASLPPGIFFLLTSRPLADLPASLVVGMDKRRQGATVVDVGLDDPGYRALLKAYFDDRVSKRREGLEKTGKPHDFRKIFEQALVKSDGRFLYLSYLADRLADDTIPLDGLDDLPSADGMFAIFLDDIERTHAGSTLGDLFSRILLHLAVAEQAFESDRDGQPAVAQEIWHGLPLELLARRVEGNSDGRVSVKLAYALYTLKPTLGSWKGGEGRHANFQLGLKGLADVIQARWPDELRHLHARQAQDLIERLTRANPAGDDAPTELDADEAWTLTYLAAHLALGGAERAIDESTRATLDVQLGTRGNQAESTLRHRAAVRWRTRQIGLESALTVGFGLVDVAYRVSVLLSARANALRETGEVAGALEDQGRAIDLLVSLRDLLGDQWSPVLASQLATASSSRAVALVDSGDLAGALQEHGRAIGILEGLDRPGRELSSDLASTLAAAYSNRGVALGQTGDLAGARDDHGRAIGLYERLRERLGQDWSPDMAFALAIAYGNRGIVRDDLGDVAGALEDQGRVIDILERVRERSADRWSPDMARLLATDYGNRGSVLAATGEIAGALADQGRAIDILESLRVQLADDWSPDLASRLATSYVNRGTALVGTGDFGASLEVFGRAIDILEGLRERLGPEMPIGLVSCLALAYANRGAAVKSQHVV